MNSKLYIILMCFGLIETSQTLLAQSKPTKDKESVYNEEDLYEDDPYYWSFTKEIGLNFTPLISKFVPFNLGKNDAGLVGLKYKKYYDKRAFLVDFGTNINPVQFENNAENPFFYLGLGIEGRYPITKDNKLAYTSSYDIFFSIEGVEGFSALGFSKGYGLEYHISKRFFISTEAKLQLANFNFGEGVLLKFLTPQAIFVNIRLY